jgi:hypothetical protein
VSAEINARRAQLLVERDELSRTVAELADRFDVGRGMRESGARMRARALHSPLFIPMAAAVGAMLALALGAAVRSRSRARVTAD